MQIRPRIERRHIVRSLSLLAQHFAIYH
jgi:hypothetical protein